jgi:hypothetical protein
VEYAWESLPSEGPEFDTLLEPLGFGARRLGAAGADNGNAARVNPG